MPDFRAHVRARLPIPDIPGPQQADAVEELALDLEQRYEAAIRRGSSPDESWRQVTEAVDWSYLAHAFRESSEEVSGRARSEQQREGPPHMSKQGVFSSFLSDVRYAFRSLRK